MLRAKNDSILAVRRTIPWWASLAGAAGAYIFCRFVIPLLISGDPDWDALGSWLTDGAPYPALTVAAVGAFAFFRDLDLRRLRETKTELESIRAMDWQNFELMIAEGFRRLGYAVDNRGWYVPSSQVHISLNKDGERMLVECRQWRASEVGLGPVRELYRMMASEHADGALFVTSGDFTPDARAFARDKPIGLIDGKALLELVEAVQKDAPRDDVAPAVPCCPVCERSMVKRKAGRGSTIGQVFWSCSAYPRCLGARPL